MKTVIDMIIRAYVEVYGIEKWNSLTDEQKHDAIMIIAKDFKSALERL